MVCRVRLGRRPRSSPTLPGAPEMYMYYHLHNNVASFSDVGITPQFDSAREESRACWLHEELHLF